MPNLASLTLARATLTECGIARDALVLRDHEGVEIAHAKPSPENEAALNALAATFNALRHLQGAVQRHVAMNPDGSLTFDHLRQMPREMRTGLNEAVAVLRTVHLLAQEAAHAG